MRLVLGAVFCAMTAVLALAEPADGLLPGRWLGVLAVTKVCAALCALAAYVALRDCETGEKQTKKNDTGLWK